jgi:calcium binding protein 39
MPPGLFAKLVKERPKSPAEVLTKAVAALQALSARDKDNPLSTGAKEQAQVHKYLGYLKFFLFGDEQGGGHDPTKESVMALVNQVVKTDFQSLLVENLVNLEFEARKDAAQVFGAIVRIRDDTADPACPGAQYVLQHQDILRILFEGWVAHFRRPCCLITLVAHPCVFVRTLQRA